MNKVLEMFNFFKKSEDIVEPKIVEEKIIYKEKMDIVYKSGEVLEITGESECNPALWTRNDVNPDRLIIYTYQLPSTHNKTYYINKNDINYIQNYKTEIIKGE